MDTILLALAVLLMGLLGWYLAAASKLKRQPSPFVLPSGMTVTAVPFVTETDVALYNLLRLAVQDRYLVFAQVPLLSFVSVDAMGQARATALNHMALKRVDFVLVHPGSRLVDQVVQLQEEVPRPVQAERQRVIEAVLQAAGIQLVTLRGQQSYTVPTLTALLGLASEE